MSALKALAKATRTIQRQQTTIDEQRRRVASLERQVAFIAKAAGLDRHLAALRRQADEDNPANPVPAPPSDSPEFTTEDTLGDVKRDQPGGGSETDDVEEKGSTSETDVSADARTDVESPGGDLDVERNPDKVDVTAPVSGTEEQRPLDETKTESDVVIDDPNKPDSAFDDGQLPERQTTGSKEPTQPRVVAALRLARLRIQAGISETDDDLELSTNIARDASLSDDDIRRETKTLTQVVKASAKASGGGRRPDASSRHLVPQRAASRQAGDRSAPSLAGREPKVSAARQAATVGAGAGVGEDEFLFD